jgi:hypothetical protein
MSIAGHKRTAVLFKATLDLVEYVANKWAPVIRQRHAPDNCYRSRFSHLDYSIRMRRDREAGFGIRRRFGVLRETNANFSLQTCSNSLKSIKPMLFDLLQTTGILLQRG